MAPTDQQLKPLAVRACSSFAQREGDRFRALGYPTEVRSRLMSVAGDDILEGVELRGRSLAPDQ